jgi:deoxyribodipyrimidine photo-lyase
MHVVWFKRDLRIEYHIALVEAVKHGPVLPLYIFEPELWKPPDLSYRHYQFLKECLAELDQLLHGLGQRLIIKVGDAVEILEQLNERYSIQILWSHQETWNGWTYARDKNFEQWTKDHNISWHELIQYGVIRCLNESDGLASRWYGEMKKPVLNSPKRLCPVDEACDLLPSEKKLGLHYDDGMILRKAGRAEGLKLLHSFLSERREGYKKDMSSPVTAFERCSRLSGHLAFGCISIREVFHALEQRIQ